MFPADFIVPHPIWIAVAIIVAIIVVKSIRIANQYERAVVFRLGKFNRTAGPGLYFVWLFIEWQSTLDMRTMTTAVEQQEAISRDNVPVKVDAVIWFKSSIQTRGHASRRRRQFRRQVALTSLRNLSVSIRSTTS